MWLFGIFEGFFKDPLFAGRLISVLAGFFSILGLYNLGKEVFNKKIAYIAPLLYIVIPIFSFFDRQASMESAEAATSVWITYLFIKLLKTHSVKIAIALGIIIGIGFFIKSTIRVSSYFEARIISNLSSYKCLTYRVPVYFVSRGNFLGGLDNYLQLERKFYNPEEKSSVGIYVFKSSCSGQTLDLSSPGAILQPKN
jgi:uncharacterized membrane protein